ncbi:hypothetical protein [Exiguobacterium sp. AM39-5BH]|uniref:hypothetical protein n=1 Tax=Exiguobacterium sp. AM39-5BH TaxID=2292355 RepID=UPI000FE19AFD|nr:hypothetical protein [Exiguobacterium sp. AM39-5BH]RHB51808.1 hypothetical protein DW881_01100 [Exiguobacterium sp. AM39-5BH]
MDGLWVLLLAAFGIASAVMKRMEKPSSTGERPPSTDLKRYLDTVGDMVKEIEGTFDESRDSKEKPVPQKLRRRVAVPAETQERQVPHRREELPHVSAQFEQTVKIPPIPETSKVRPRQRVSMKQVRQAVVWSEILQPPVSKRRR